MSERTANLTNISGNSSKRVRVPIVIPAPSPTDVPSSSFSPSPSPDPVSVSDPVSFSDTVSTSDPVSVSVSDPDSVPCSSFDSSAPLHLDSYVKTEDIRDISDPEPVPCSSFDSSAPLHLDSHVKTEGIRNVSDLTSQMIGTQMQLLYQFLQQQQQQYQQQQQQIQEQQQRQQEQQQREMLRGEIDKIKKDCGNYLTEYYHGYVAGHEIDFDVNESITHKTNRKVRRLLHQQVRKNRCFNVLTDSQIFTMIRSRYYYMVCKAKGKTAATAKSACRNRVKAKLSIRRSVYMANPSAFDARFPFAGKILTVDWTSDEEDGPEDDYGRTFLVKRPSFRSNEVLEFHKELQKAYKESLKVKKAPPTVRRRIENVEAEFPDKIDHEYYPSWAFSSPGLGFPTSVSGSSFSAAANPMQ
ncbi:hypothetical protein G6F55_005954 [Rhizopus delemar]|uniref:Uncharacterized protein n=3 Tax=Rhizopus TaxID=4842 RepID=I1BLX5_RHIO9|nr:hypothetical protein RO3G_01909 [Rhizopus delemar RA 99-880]KAG1457402.1 hypothetical protein G6F55_005954 [Rhizopus delemar]KAG1542160.1 hypothetical protein G6F51_007449 [Rhizopus arrhizus]KAG1493190.1 hypothetical protein G6F54_008762 [Rhizopus delemar]KAG1507099.1 hypothetical protein G6F53_009204 [Rhizopus delemar]|eukprot:EIE77205.1 hypothetical protein RO3G_01909 [Rhizopus delemar RA 99-880]